MKPLSLPAFLAALLVVSPAFAQFEARPCDEAGVRIESLNQPIASNSVTLYEGKVAGYNVDTIEPACCSAGVAVVIPDAEDPLGGSKCVAVTGFVSVDITKARRSYDPKRGLLLDMPAVVTNDGGQTQTSRPLRLLINLAASSVKLAR